MLLKNRTAIIYGGAGAIGSATAFAYAREGAKVFLAGRSLRPLETVVQKIKDAGGHAQAAVADALDKEAVDDHAASVFEETGSIDIAFNAIGVSHVQGIPLTALSFNDFNLPFTTFTIANFLTATAAARYMTKNKSGVILTISTPGALMADGFAGGFGVSNAAVEGLTRQLAGELGPEGIRAVCLRPDATPETMKAGSYSRELFSDRAKLLDFSLEELLSFMANRTLLKRLPTLASIVETAVFMASDHAKAITATTVNMSCGSVTV